MLKEQFDPRLYKITAEQKYPLLFATVSGAHLYGFASADSDWDLRGVHVLPLEEVIGLSVPKETIESSPGVTDDGFELDLVTHDLEKFMRLMLKPNGYVLEQLFSPLIVSTSSEHEELKALGEACITKHHVHHYLGFSRGQWKLFLKDNPPRVKPLLYVFRVLLTGIQLMRTGRIECHLGVLNDEFQLPYLGALIERKLNGREKETLEGEDMEKLEREFERLEDLLKLERDRSTLPEAPSSRQGLEDLLIRIRRQGLSSS